MPAEPVTPSLEDLRTVLETLRRETRRALGPGTTARAAPNRETEARERSGRRTGARTRRGRPSPLDTIRTVLERETLDRLRRLLLRLDVPTREDFEMLVRRVEALETAVSRLLAASGSPESRRPPPREPGRS